MQVTEVMHSLTPDSRLNARYLLCRLLHRRVEGHRIPGIHLGYGLLRVGLHTQTSLLLRLRRIHTGLGIRCIHIGVTARRKNHLRTLTNAQLRILGSLLHEVNIKFHQLTIGLRLIFHHVARIERIGIALHQEDPMLENIALTNTGTGSLLPTHHPLAGSLHHLTDRIDVADKLVMRQTHRLVTTDVHISTGSQSRQLLHDSLRQGHRLRIIHVERIQRLSGEIGIEFQLHRIGQLRIGFEDCLRMTR